MRTIEFNMNETDYQELLKFCQLPGESDKETNLRGLHSLAMRQREIDIQQGLQTAGYSTESIKSELWDEAEQLFNNTFGESSNKKKKRRL